MRENVDISELVSVSVARDLDITGDDATYVIISALEPGLQFTASSILSRATGSSTGLISMRQQERMLMPEIIVY